MDIDIQNITSRCGKLSSRVEFLQSDLVAKTKKIDSNLNKVDVLTQAKWIITETQKTTQERFKDRVEKLVTMAIKSVYDRPLGFELIFERKRDKLECRPVIHEIQNNNKEIYEDPENELGGGIIDICSFALRIVLWNMEKPKSRNVIILDEPGKNLGDLIPLFGAMLREVSHGLKFQLIIITHDQAIMEIADRAWHVEHDGTESHVVMVKDRKDELVCDLQIANEEPIKRKKRL